jgi:hypothetical protein
MKYTATVRRPDGTEYESTVDSSAGDKAAAELAKNIAELVGLKSADGEEIPMPDDQNKDTEERVDEQNKTTTERVESQEVDTKEVSPNKTGDVKPNR